MTDGARHADGDGQDEIAERNLRAMLDLSWNTDWSELPPEAERHVEEAYEHLTTARDITESENARR